MKVNVTHWLLACLGACLLSPPAGDLIATDLKLTLAKTDKNGMRSIRMDNHQAMFMLECKASADSCTLPAIGTLYTLKKSDQHLYVGDNVILAEGEKESGRFRLITVAAH